MLVFVNNPIGAVSSSMFELEIAVASLAPRLACGPRQLSLHDGHN